MNPPQRRVSNFKTAVPASRRGIGMAEILAATALMSVVTAIALPIVAGVAAVREESTQRQFAVLEVANLMERIAAARRQGALTDEWLGSLSLPDETARQFDEPDLKVELAPAAGTPAARELSVSLSWLNSSGERAQPIRVTAFLYEPQEAP